PRRLAPELMPTTRAALALWFGQAFIGIGAALSYMFLLTMVLLLVRRHWLAILLSTIVMLLVSMTTSAPDSVIAIGLFLRTIFLFGLVWFALTKFGVLTAAVLVYVHAINNAFLLTTNPLAWYANDGFLLAATILALAAYGFHTTLAGRSLWSRFVPDPSVDS